MQAPKVDTSVAEAYEAALVPGLVVPWAEVIVCDAQIKDGMSVLDVACGTGIATRYAARRCGVNGRAIGIDIDHGMLEVAKMLSMNEGLHTEYLYGSACELPFESESFDAALCLQGLQYFPDQLKAMTELRRVLRPGSLLIVITWSEIQNCKGYWAMVSALECRGIDAAAARKPFSLSNPVAMQSRLKKPSLIKSQYERSNVSRAFHQQRLSSMRCRVARPLPGMRWKKYLPPIGKIFLLRLAMDLSNGNMSPA